MVAALTALATLDPKHATRTDITFVSDPRVGPPVTS